MKLIALGMIGGIGGALVATRFIQSMLYQTPARDPLVFAAVSALLAVVAALACLIPALRATKVDPMVALRAE
jgi:ABC-type antimicrobial peptide transport system permease subunit